MTPERSLFLTKFFKEPAAIGSITPSSKYLMKDMVRDLPWDSLHTIVELGAGTGAFTKYIAAYKKPEATYLIIEKDAELRTLLKEKYSDFFYGAQAEKINWYLQNQNIHQADCIVSGLPFANFSEETRQKIVDEVKKSLKPGGYFVAFQYSLQMKNMLEKNFSQVQWSFVLRNFPCAFVYHCRK